MAKSGKTSYPPALRQAMLRDAQKQTPKRKAKCKHKTVRELRQNHASR